MRCLPGRRRQLNNSKARDGVAGYTIGRGGTVPLVTQAFAAGAAWAQHFGLLLQMPANRTTISRLNFSAASKGRITASVHADL
jgi:hypothetical protein